jgi:hypothetical protein
MLRNQESFQKAFILKELLDRPLALRTGDQQPG